MLNVSISENDLIVDVPYDSIEEVTVGKLTPKSYQLKSISLFPYLYQSQQMTQVEPEGKRHRM